MPLYEYVCGQCGAHREALRSSSLADEPIECERCGSDDSSRQLSRFCAMSAGADGGHSIAGGGCGSCAGGHCATCGSH